MPLQRLEALEAAAGAAELDAMGRDPYQTENPDIAASALSAHRCKHGGIRRWDGMRSVELLQAPDTATCLHARAYEHIYFTLPSSRTCCMCRPNCAMALRKDGPASRQTQRT